MVLVNLLQEAVALAQGAQALAQAGAPTGGARLLQRQHCRCQGVQLGTYRVVQVRIDDADGREATGRLGRTHSVSFCT